MTVLPSYRNQSIDLLCKSDSKSAENTWYISILAICKNRRNQIQVVPLLYRPKQLQEVFLKNRNCKNFANFTGKHMCQSLFFNKVASLFSFQFKSNYVISNDSLMTNHKSCLKSSTMFLLKHYLYVDSLLVVQSYIVFHV